MACIDNEKKINNIFRSLQIGYHSFYAHVVSHLVKILAMKNFRVVCINRMNFNWYCSGSLSNHSLKAPEDKHNWLLHLLKHWHQCHLNQRHLQVSRISSTFSSEYCERFSVRWWRISGWPHENDSNSQIWRAISILSSRWALRNPSPDGNGGQFTLFKSLRDNSLLHEQNSFSPARSASTLRPLSPKLTLTNFKSEEIAGNLVQPP